VILFTKVTKSDAVSMIVIHQAEYGP